MFHKICEMLRLILQNERMHNKRIIQQDDTCETTTLAIDELPKTRVKQLITIEEAIKNVKELMSTPTDLHLIQPRASQVWNCDEIGLDPNEKRSKIVCTYKWCGTEQI